MKKIYFNIIAAFVFSYFISSVLINSVFLAYSPKIRPNLGQYIALQIKNSANSLIAKFTFKIPTYKGNSNSEVVNIQNNPQMVKVLQNSLRPVTKGVSAAAIGNYTYNKYVIDEIEWVQIKYTLSNGKDIIISYPKGTVPPPKEVFEE